MLLRSVESGLVGAAPARGVAAAGAGRRTPEPGHGRREPRLGEPVLSSARGRARHPHTQGVAGGGHHRVPGDIQLEATSPQRQYFPSLPGVKLDISDWVGMLPRQDPDPLARVRPPEVQPPVRGARHHELAVRGEARLDVDTLQKDR